MAWPSSPTRSSSRATQPRAQPAVCNQPHAADGAHVSVTSRVRSCAAAVGTLSCCLPSVFASCKQLRCRRLEQPGSVCKCMRYLRACAVQIYIQPCSDWHGACALKVRFPKRDADPSHCHAAFTGSGTSLAAITVRVTMSRPVHCRLWSHLPHLHIILLSWTPDVVIRLQP